MAVTRVNTESFKVEGIEELVAKLTKIGDPKKTRSTLLKLLRKQARPIVQAARQEAPVGDKEHKRYLNGQVVASYKPGNLAKSIQVIPGKKGSARVNPIVYIGPRAGKKSTYDGYYGHIVHYDNARSKARVVVPGNPFMDRAWKAVGNSSTEATRQQVAKVIQKEIDRYSSK
jgi:hypothetical protein